MINKNTFEDEDERRLKTSSRRLHQDECLLASGVVTHDYTSNLSRAAACCYSISINLLAKYNENH